MKNREDSKSLSRLRYTKFGHGYVTSPTHAKGSELDRLLELAQPQADWIMLDVATGGGHTALRFAPHVARVIATDLTPRMIDVAQRFVLSQGISNVEFRLADAENLPFDPDTFDLVTCRIAAHHFPDPARFVREAARSLKSNGLLLIQDQVVPEDLPTADYVNAFERLRDPSHHRTLAESEWVAIFENAGFRLEHIEQIVKRHSFQQWTEIQGCSPNAIRKLKEMLLMAPSVAEAWLEPQDVGTPQASFVNRHILIAGRKK
jgi:ubiquinone/menaquinone biosynthesis C-methylase UbiE